jgi:hypothetical protein
MNATNLMRRANIAYATAYGLSKGQGTAISFDVLDALCEFCWSARGKNIGVSSEKVTSLFDKRLYLKYS